VIGGKEQTGEWGLDARFGKPELINRIRKIGRYKSRIKLYQLDALEFTKTVIPNVARFTDAVPDAVPGEVWPLGLVPIPAHDR
jgi:hypothetical protein